MLTNPAIISLGIEVVRSTLFHFCDLYPKLPLVSVGCGSALIERSVRSLTKNEFIMVDPAPNSYYKMTHFENHVKEFGLPIDYAYTKDLAYKRPELTVGRACLLFLNWCSPGEDDYDLEAIRILKPRAILVIIDTKERAGSKQFHAFQNKPNIYKPLSIHNVRDPCKDKYACAHTSTSMQCLVDIDVNIPPSIEVALCGHDHSENNKPNLELLQNEEDEEFQICLLLKKIEGLHRELKDNLAYERREEPLTYEEEMKKNNK